MKKLINLLGQSKAWVPSKDIVKKGSRIIIWIKVIKLDWKEEEI